MKRRTFLAGVSTAFASAAFPQSEPPETDLPETDLPEIDLRDAVLAIAEAASPREKKAAQVLIEEVQRRTQIRLPLASKSSSNLTIYLATQASAHRLSPRLSSALNALANLPREGFVIRSGTDAGARWIALLGADERGLFYSVGRFLYSANFSRQSARIQTRFLNLATSPKVALRGHQLGYRPKTNAYDAWDVPMWEQYIRDLTMFGTNAIELLPPHTDDQPDSPHFPLPPEQMMTAMSHICDAYDLAVWIWYPAMARDYADPATVQSALSDWARIFQIVPRLDAIFVPGGDPGHTEPKAMLAFLEKQKTNLRRFHPKAQLWMSPQGFDENWLNEFFSLIEGNANAWLDGVVFGPQSRLSLGEFRASLPKRYPIRFYPDITHSLSCQFPVPDWDLAFALTEGRECINPRPADESNILRRSLPHSIGFLTYSEGCNDDVNKFIWSSLSWNPDLPVLNALRNFSRYFFGETYSEGIAQGILHLENNWRGPLAANDAVSVTLARFQDLERAAPPQLLENWRFQQLLYRAYYDASLHSRLLAENAAVARARDILERFNQIGWSPAPSDIGGQPGVAPPNSPPNNIDSTLFLDEALHTLEAALTNPAGAIFGARVRELGAALFQSIHMQLAVDRYRAEAVSRAANLETLETPIADVAWLRAQLLAIRKLSSASHRIAAVRTLLTRTDPGPAGFYDELGNPSNRPHLILGPGAVQDPEFRRSALTAFDYPDTLGDTAPAAWKHWAESLYDAPLQMHYDGLDPNAPYKIRVVYPAGARRMRIRLVANQQQEVHPLLERPWPPHPLEFDLPPETTNTGQLSLAWTREPGLGGNGRGCQVAEVWIMKK